MHEKGLQTGESKPGCGQFLIHPVRRRRGQQFNSTGLPSYSWTYEIPASVSIPDIRGEEIVRHQRAKEDAVANRAAGAAACQLGGVG